MHRLTYWFMIAALMTVGCSDWGGKFDPERVPNPEDQAQDVVHRNLNCHDGGPIWHWMGDDPGGYYWEDQNGGRHYGTPPCIDPAELPQNVPDTREGLGLVPDAEGNIAPRMWALKWTAESEGRYSVDDRFDLSVAWEGSWQLPFDSDADLLTAIGETNISYTKISVTDSEPGYPILVSFHQIRLGDAINLMDAMGISEVTTEYREKTYLLELDGAPPDDYTSALIYLAGDLVLKIELR